MNIKNSILLRVRISFMVILLFAMAIVFKIGHIQFVEGDKWVALAEQFNLQYRPVKATRGNILSDNGSPMATSLPFYKVALDPSRASAELFQSGIDELSQNLSKFYKDGTAKAYKTKIVRARNSGKKYVLLNRNEIGYQDKKMISQWPIFSEGRLDGGVLFEKADKRFLPFEFLANRTVGYINENNEGAGLEYSFNKHLAGTDGKALYQKMAGSSWKPVPDASEIRPEEGYDIETTIDVNLQDVTTSALLSALSRHGADYGTVVVMEVATGEIKAISNLSKTQSGKYAERYNYAVGTHGLREPGSTFKLATMIALLEETNISPLDSIDTGNGVYDIYENTITDHEEGGYGKITIKEAFEHSSNIAMAKLAYKHFGLKPSNFYHHLERMNLTKPLGFQMIGEGEPKVKSPEEWSGLTLPWMAHGYGLELTPLHTLTLYNAVANNGKMVTPIIVRSITKADKSVEKFKSVILNKKICSESTLKTVRAMLEGVVENGTAQNIKNAHYKIAGKTGTAVTLKNGKYQKEYMTSFAGYFPADAPQYSAIVVIENPQGFYQYGSNVAAPVFKEIADKIYARNIEMHDVLTNEFKVEPGVFPVIRAGNHSELKMICNVLGISNHSKGEGTWVRAERNNNAVDWNPNEPQKGITPDVNGMTLRDALYVLESSGLRVSISGTGRVKKQSVPPGRKVEKGHKIQIELG